ncbi:MAG: NosD domain-containing protein, partial [Candidatus Micrarchaeota archaeon]
RLVYSNSNRIDPSYFCNNTGNGITVNNSNDTIIDDSVACNNTANGIEIIDSNNTLINRSQVYNNSYGVYMTNADYSNFTTSNITNNTNDGIRFDSGSVGSSLSSDYICFNGLDINNQGSSNAGALDRCDSFISWTENGHYGCEYSCSSMWHRFFGNVSGNIILGDNESNLVYSWNASGFNVYFADYDSVISWYDLQAIGLDTSNSTSSNDFTELDTAFGTTLFSDNINRTYSTDGSNPIETDNFTVYGRPIDLVPVANSTAFNTTFRTGILWDMSDDGGDSEYSNADNESTVWLVKVNASSADVYGTYDYLIQIPYTLATYEGSNDLVSVYLELQ